MYANIATKAKTGNKASQIFNSLFTLIFWFSIFALTFYIVAICLAGDFIPSKWTKNLIYKSGGAGHSLNRFDEVKNKENVDILFLGSSHTYRGFDNRIFNNASANGFTSFNLGSSAQTPIQTEVLLNRYLNQLNPKIAIYEVYPITFTLDGIESAMDLISNDQNGIILPISKLNLCFLEK